MDQQFLERFLEMLDVIVNDDAPASEKKANLKAAMGDDDETNVAEFASWFATEDKTDLSTEG